MQDFFRRIGALLRFGRKPARAAAPHLRVVETPRDGVGAAPRGRGSGRGLTPPTPPKARRNRPNRRGKK